MTRPGSQHGEGTAGPRLPGANWFVRPARLADIDALFELASMTGGGFTNLPPDRDALVKRLQRSEQANARSIDTPKDELYILLLEDALTGRVGGSAAIFSKLGAVWPFYSYKLGTITQFSHMLGRGFSTQILTLVNDHEGATEVGGLFLRPELRSGGLGRLLARSRYMFIAQHRQRFCEKVLAELRGWQTTDGESPFWDGIGKLFFGMAFHEADHFNAINGNQFIADLMPKHPIYVAMLSESAKRAIGKPHDSGVGAMRMLEQEGFGYDGYIDIFDGGPTMCARTDNLATIRSCRETRVAGHAQGREDLAPTLLAAGRLNGFRCWMGMAAITEDGGLLPEADRSQHALVTGEKLLHAPV